MPHCTNCILRTERDGSHFIVARFYSIYSILECPQPKHCPSSNGGTHRGTLRNLSHNPPGCHAISGHFRIRPTCALAYLLVMRTV
ncbi:hypothetical protein PoB_000308300 [Plakobranchus ocellatus]|uniref:Uncharacterized protein n=1 Tax=Plakobranchus ocellatus TaxID=259542 RepID=A0AAV3Y1R7_9GAST|nr:hypothetical protein PoB_000308300 [Plakobranchus ocellatus]